MATRSEQITYEVKNKYVVIQVRLVNGKVDRLRMSPGLQTESIVSGEITIHPRSLPDFEGIFAMKHALDDLIKSLRQEGILPTEEAPEKETLDQFAKLLAQTDMTFDERQRMIWLLDDAFAGAETPTLVPDFVPKDKDPFYEDDLKRFCGTCQKLMQHVRPGKWQCNHCETLEPPMIVGDKLGSPNLYDRKQTMEWIEGAIENLEESHQELYKRTEREGTSYADSQILCFLGDREAELMKERDWRKSVGVVDPLLSGGFAKEIEISSLLGIPAIVNPDDPPMLVPDETEPLITVPPLSLREVNLAPDETLEDSDDEERTKKWIDGAIASYEKACLDLQKMQGADTPLADRRVESLQNRLNEMYTVKNGILARAEKKPQHLRDLDDEIASWDAASDEALEKVDTLISTDEELGQARALLEAMCAEMVKDGYTEKRNDLLNRADAFLRGSCD